MSVTRVLMPHLTLSGQAARDQFFAELNELLAVDGRLFVGEDEEADLMIAHQRLDLVDHLLGIADAIVAPEFPLRAERTGERTAARHVGNSDAHAERHVDVLFPLQQRPVGIDGVEILDRRRGGRRDDHAVVGGVGEALDLGACVRPALFCDGAHEVREDLLAFAAHDDIDPRRFGQHLLVHEGRVDAAQHAERVRHDLLGDLERALGRVDRWRDGGQADDVGLRVRSAARAGPLRRGCWSSRR